MLPAPCSTSSRFFAKVSSPQNGANGTALPRAAVLLLEPELPRGEPEPVARSRLHILELHVYEITLTSKSSTIARNRARRSNAFCPADRIGEGATGGAGTYSATDGGLAPSATGCLSAPCTVEAGGVL